MATFYVGPRPVLRGQNTNDMVNPYYTLTGKAKGKGDSDTLSEALNKASSDKEKMDIVRKMMKQHNIKLDGPWR